MTRKRNDNHSTEFGLWLRKQPEIKSELGFRAYNLDYVWWLKSGFDKMPVNFMFIEEKRFMSRLRADQRLTYSWLHKKISQLRDPTYKGIHLLEFENTSPQDGKIYLNKTEINRTELIEFLTFLK